MADKKLLRKIAPIIMSAAVAMTSSPVGVMAEDFTSGEAAVEVSEETAYGSDEISDDYDESSEADDSADFGTDTEDGFESGEAAEEESGFEDGETGDTEDAFLADTEGEINNEAGAVKTVEDGQIVLMNIPYEAFYRSELKNNDVKVDAFTSATLNKSRTKGMMNGNAAYYAMAAIFFAQMFGIELTITQYIAIIFTSTVGAVGQAGVPGPTLLVVAVLMSANIPIEALPILFGVDRIFDMLRTAVNITGDAACATIVDRFRE